MHVREAVFDVLREKGAERASHRAHGPAIHDLAAAMSEVWAHDLLRQIMQSQGCAGASEINAFAAGLRLHCEVDYRGVRMLVHPSDNNTEFQIWKLGRTHEEKPLRTHSGQRLVGAGVFLPLMSVPMPAVFRDPPGGGRCGTGSVGFDAFEPNPVMRARLEQNCKLNGFSQVHIHDCAISDEPGEIHLHLPDVPNLGQARLHEAYEGGKSVRVPVRCLADFAPEGGETVDLLKADVEGFEDRVIVPYLETVDPGHQPRMIFFEHKHDGNWSLDLPGTLARNGYDLVREYGRNALYAKSD